MAFANFGKELVMNVYIKIKGYQLLLQLNIANQTQGLQMILRKTILKSLSISLRHVQ